jgi:hypothetical protein
MRAARDPGALNENEFDRLLADSLNQSAATVLGEIASKALFEVIENKYAVARNRIPERPEELTLALERSVGIAVSKTIERIVAKRLYSKLGLTFVGKTNWRLADYVREARVKASGLTDPAEHL